MLFAQSRRRRLEAKLAQAFFRGALAVAREKDLLSDEHFMVDRTLIEAWAGHKTPRGRRSVRRTGPDGPGSSGSHFRGGRGKNATDEFATDLDARLFRKGSGKVANLCYRGHSLMDNRHGLVVHARYTQGSRKTKRETAQEMVRAVRRRCRWRLIAGAEKAFDAHSLVASLRVLGQAAQVQKTCNRLSAIDRRSTCHAGYQLRQWKRKLIEQPFGWINTAGALRKTSLRGAG